MPTLRLFNPQNDLALAANLAGSYTPPREAAVLARAGALLPVWWADDGDTVIAPGQKDEAARLRREFGLRFELGCAEKCSCASPWGWSHNAVWIMEKAGCRKEILPSEFSLDALRLLSHRRTAMQLRRDLGVEAGYEVTNLETAREIIDRHRAKLFLKSPWSCSGRGVVPLEGILTASSLKLIEGIIRRQGSAMLERAWTPGLDFAALFEAESGIVKFAGWSIFSASAAGSYAGNLVAPQWKLVEKLNSITDYGKLTVTVATLENSLTKLLAPIDYSGPLGIDMLVSPDGQLNPCIELNLRRTMGFVARDIHSRLGIEGKLVMSAPPDSLMLTAPHANFAIGIIRSGL